jgi:hypothetical protein
VSRFDRPLLRVIDTDGRALGPVAESAGTLAVTLFDGTVWSVPFLREPTAKIELVPEPASALGALAAVAGLAAVARRRARGSQAAGRLRP